MSTYIIAQSSAGINKRSSFCYDFSKISASTESASSI